MMMGQIAKFGDVSVSGSCSRIGGGNFILPTHGLDVKLGALVFRCPTTQREIESGIASDAGTFRCIGQLSVVVLCQACRCHHHFTAASGSLLPLREQEHIERRARLRASEAPTRIIK
jgi:hypothetical protein